MQNVCHCAPLMVMILSFSLNAQPQRETPPGSTTNRRPSFDELSLVTPAFLREHDLNKPSASPTRGHTRRKGTNPISGAEDQLKKLQYYTDGPIILSRVITSEDKRIASGKLVAVSGRSYEIVVIERGTPGIATDVHMNSVTGEFEAISISFEPNCTMLYLWSDVSNASLLPNEESYCRLRFIRGVPDEAKEAARLQGIDVDEKNYHPPNLFVDFRPAKIDVKTRVVPGRTLDK